MDAHSGDRVPVANPRAAYLEHKQEIDAAMSEVLDRGIYILGDQVTRFEEEFAAYLGVRHAVGVANGTDAVELALRAAGIGEGSAVLTVANTAVATVAAIQRTGAEVVFADVDAATFVIDCAHAAETIRRHTAPPIRAIVPVHLFGHPAPMAEVANLATKHGLIVVEDCAQAHGASIDGRRVGSFGTAAAFSFYPTKNLGALGDGGAVVTDDATIANRLRALRQYGWRERYISESRGGNSRLDEIQAAVLRVKLRSLDRENERRRVIAATYRAAIVSMDTMTAPREVAGCLPVYHQFVVRTPRRDALRQSLDAQGVDTAIHYPVPVHLQPAYRTEFAVPLPVTERLAKQIVSLPMWPQMDAGIIRRVVEALEVGRFTITESGS